MESSEGSEAKALAVVEELEQVRLGEVARVFREAFSETLVHAGFPREHWCRIRTKNEIERLSREISRRTRVVGIFPDGKSALMLVATRLKYVAKSECRSRRYLDVTLFDEWSSQMLGLWSCRKLARILTVPLAKDLAREFSSKRAKKKVGTTLAKHGARYH